MIYTYKYRLYPTEVRSQALDFLLLQGRNVYNTALEQRITVYQETSKSVTYPQQWAYFRDMRHKQPETLGQLNATCMQQLLRRLDKAFRAFFRRLKAGETPGFPRFKGENRFNSLEFSYGDGCKLRFDEKQRALLYVQNVGEIKIKYHRPIPDDATLKHVILKRSNRKWYVCLQLKTPEQSAPVHNGPVVGIDVGLHHLLAQSDGNFVEPPHFLRNSQAKLRVAQRRTSRRKKDSHRRRKAVDQVSRLHEHVSNQRRDFWHKTTRRLVNTYSLIALEKLSLKFMITNHHLALSTHDAGLGLFHQLLAYKAASAGTQVVGVNPAYTSQMCSGCGMIVEKKLNDRVHECPSCGLTLDRDVNAAVNILNLCDQTARTGRSGLNVGGYAERAPRSLPL